MNKIQKYFLYRNLINPGPTISTKNDAVSHDLFTRIDWTYKDNKGTIYEIRSFKLSRNKNRNGDYDFYSAFVYLNGTEVAKFTGGYKAQNLYKKAESVLLMPIQSITLTIKAKTR